MTNFRAAETIAIFDVDETLIPCKSMFSFLEFSMQTKFGKVDGLQRYAICRAELE